MPRGRSAPAPASRASAAASRPRPAAAPSPSSTPQQQPHASSASTSTPASSGGWFGSRPAAPAPAMHSSAPPPAMQQSSGGGGMFSGLMGSVVTGAAMGTGSAVAHRAVDSFMGPRETRVVHEQSPGEPAPAAPMAPAQSAEGPCGDRIKQFAECMSNYRGDMGACQHYFDAMQQCKTSFA